MPRTPTRQLSPSRRGRDARRSRPAVELLEDRSVPTVSTVYVNDNWHLVTDVDNSGTLTLYDEIRNNNDTLAPGTITAFYGLDGFGVVTSGAVTGSLAAYDSINDAIAGTSTGGTVHVLQGAYSESVSVDKTLTLLGAQAGVDARTRGSVPETIVSNASAAFDLEANNITLDGFTITGGTGGALGGSGIHAAGFAGYAIRNNIVTGNVIGLFANVTGSSLVERNLFDGNNNPGAAGGAGIYTDSSVGLTIDDNEFRNHTLNNPILIAATLPISHISLTVSDNFIHDNVSGIFALGISGGLFQGNTITTGGTATALTLGGSNIAIDVLRNDLSGNLRGLRIADFGFLGVTPNSDIEAHFNSFAGNTEYGAGISDEGVPLTDGYIGTLDLTCNWWGSVTGPTSAANPGGSGTVLRNDFADIIDFQPWLLYADADASAVGFQIPTTFTVTAQTTGFTTTNNNYRRLVNAIECLQDGQMVVLSGTFDWTETNAAASWALGNDGLASLADNYTLTVRPNLNGVILTAATPGAATIQGPGDLAAVNLEGFLNFDGGDNQNWTISNLAIHDFDLAIGMFNGTGGTDAFNNTAILDNHIRVPADLNATAAPADVNQNIGIHFSFGTNQTIQGNTIEIVGSGLSDGAILSSSVGMQSNTSGGNVYDGLLIDGNTINVTGAQSAQPPRILGIWENGHAHTSDITVSNNTFNNQTTGGTAATNVMRAFRVTSHSGATTTVAYNGNTVTGANIGFEWLAGSNFSGNQPVRLIGNTLTGVHTGVLVQSNGVALLSDNTLVGTGAVDSVGVDVLAGSIATLDDSTAANSITGFDTGVLVAGSARIFNSTISGNTIGIDAHDTTARVLIQGNDLRGNTTGILIREGAVVDAGDLAAGNTTGLGSSTGNNDLRGYSGVTLAIDNQNLDADGDPNVKAENNNFGTDLISVAETVVRHTVDNPALTLVDFDPLLKPPHVALLAVGAAGGQPRVRVYNFDGSLRFDFLAYGSTFTGGVRVALGDVTGDGTADIITAPGPGIAPRVKIFDGVTGSLVTSFLAYGSTFTGGVFVAAGDVTDDGTADIVTGAGGGGTRSVKVFDSDTGTMASKLLPYGTSYTGAVRVAAGDVNGDDVADIITAPGGGFARRVKVFDGTTSTVIQSFFAYGSSFTGGVFVAAGDVTGDGLADIITGAGAGGSRPVKVFDGDTGTMDSKFFPYGTSYTGAVRVATTDLNGDDVSDIITGGGIPATVKVFDGTDLSVEFEVFPFGPSFNGGIYVGGS